MQRTMKVYPNPWGVHPQYLVERKTLRGKVLPVGDVPHSIDRHGRPCHHVMVERAREAIYVGAAIDRQQTTRPETNPDYQVRSLPQETVWSFLGVPSTDPQFCAKFAAASPVEVPVTAYYIGALKAGDLLPGDGEAANVAGYRCTPSDFPKLEALARRSAGLGPAPTKPAAPAQGPTDDNDDAGKSSGKGKR